MMMVGTLNKRTFRIYLLCIVLIIEGNRGACGLFFAHKGYQTSISASHPVERPLLAMYIFDNNLQSHTLDCTLSEVRAPGTAQSSSGSDLFRLTTEGSLVQLSFRRPFDLHMGTDEKYIFTLSVRCRKGTHTEDRNNLHTPDISTAQTNVNLTVFSEGKSRQVSPCGNTNIDIRELCFFGFPDEVFIRENSTGFVATQIQGSQLGGCENITRSYTVKGQVPINLTVDRHGRLQVNEPLDYERATVKHINVQITCHAASLEDTKRVKVNVININDHLPRIEGSNKVAIGVRDILRIKKGESVDEPMMVLDKDGKEFIDEVQIDIVGDILGQFEIAHTAPSEIGDKTVLVTSLQWAGELVIPNVTYNFEVVFTDMGFARNFRQKIKRVFEVNVNLMLHRVVMDTAQQFSRVVGILPSGTDFKVLRIDGAPSTSLAITPKEKILYVNDSNHIASAAGRNLTVWLQYLAEDNINVTLRGGSRNLTTMAITVRVRESNITPTSRADCAIPCSYRRSEGACEESCGPGTGVLGGKCEWSSRCDAQNLMKNQMCTCSQDLSTCSDGVCDELEEMVPSLCPWDCQDRDVLPALYRREGRDDNGHCWCTEDDCTCGIMQDAVDKVLKDAEKRKGIHKTTTPSCGWLCITLALGGSMVVVFTLLLLGLVAYRGCRPRAAKATPEKPLNGSVASLSATPSDYVVEGGVEQQRVVSPAASQNSLDWTPRGIVIDQAWEFPRSNLKLEKSLGEGEFGRVVRAQATGISNTDGNTTVAVKMLKECATGSEFRDLISEFTLLKDVSHTNVIKLLGVCSKGGPFYLIVEYCEHGALRSFLRSCRLNESFYTDQTPVTSQEEGDQQVPENSVSANDLLSFAWQIAKGMQYLSTMKLVHRDLAARNVLVAAGKVIKISDFGLSRDIYEEDTYMKRSKGRIPVKWMAPESLYEQLYTTKSDVWSFGITLWEVVTLGATPYPGLAPERLFYRLKSGYRMEKPTHCSDQLFRVMSWCWRTLPGDRPTFTQLVDTLEAMLKQRVEYLDLGGSIDRHPILDDDNIETEDVESDHEGGYGSISRLTEDDAYLNQVNHGPHDFDDVICDDCTMRMIKEGDVTTECTKLLGAENDSLNNNGSNNKVSSRPLLYIQVEHDNSDDDSERSVSNNAEEV